MKFIIMVWLAFLARHKSGFNDGEPGLHEHDQETCDQRPGEVDTNAVLAYLIYEIGQRDAFVGIGFDHIVSGSSLGSAGIACSLFIGRWTTYRQSRVHCG